MQYSEFLYAKFREFNGRFRNVKIILEFENKIQKFCEPKMFAFLLTLSQLSIAGSISLIKACVTENYIESTMINEF